MCVPTIVMCSSSAAICLPTGWCAPLGGKYFFLRGDVHPLCGKSICQHPFFIPTPALFYPSGGCRCRPEENIFSTEGSRGGLEENIFPTEVVGTTWLADGSATDKLHINILVNISKLWWGSLTYVSYLFLVYTPPPPPPPPEYPKTPCAGLPYVQKATPWSKSGTGNVYLLTLCGRTQQ